MPTPVKGARLGGSPAHERLILANMATALFEHRQITTTETRAKRLRPLAERLISQAKRGDLASRRRVMRTVRDKSVVHFLFTEIAPAMAERNGGYTRIIKLENRRGDNAPMAVISLVMEPVSPKQAVKKEAEKVTKKAAAKSEAAAPAAKSEAAAPAAADDVQVGKYENSALPAAGGAAPSDDYTVKGNEDSMKYHTTESRWYESTVAEVWFKTAADAEAAGFTAPGAKAAETDADA